MPMVDNSNRRGDHFVTFEVALPSRLTERQKELLLEFAKTETINGTVEGLTSATATDSASSADEASGVKRER